MLRLTATALVVVMAMTSAAWAGATVVVVKSPVMVSHGEGYSEVTTSIAAARGDQVMAGPQGQARIVYPDGCTVQVGPGGVASVGECKQPMTAGLDSNICDPSTDDKCLAAPPPAPRPPYLLYGGIAAGIAVGICAAQGCFDDNDHPRSP
jgi:hypothetical protein